MNTNTTTTSVEADVRAFAALYPMPNVLAALAHCESGRLPWEAVAALFARALAKTLPAR